MCKVGESLFVCLTMECGEGGGGKADVDRDVSTAITAGLHHHGMK